MPLSDQDLLKGLDFTGINPATGADHNNLLELAAPVSDSASEGKGLIVWTVDSALDTPIVPDASITTKWKRYLWIRVPHSTAANTSPIIYAWNPNVASDPTYLQWVVNQFDESGLQAQIDALDTRVDGVEATANNANSVAGIANGNASSALVVANAAKAQSTTADANATQAIADASAAQNSANAANATAESALDVANTAQTTANTALANSAPTASNRFFTSTAAVIVANGICINEPHNLGATPKFVRCVLRCNVADAVLGFAIGDEIEANYISDGDSNGCPFSVMANATNVVVSRFQRIGCAKILTPSGRADFATIANWTVKAYCWA